MEMWIFFEKRLSIIIKILVKCQFYMTSPAMLHESVFLHKKLN